MVTKEEVLTALHAVEDPELGMSIVDLGLVYRVEPREDLVEVDFTLTYPGCPAESIIRADIAKEVKKVLGLATKLKTVWTPRWGPERMTEEARVTLGYPI
jgi:metal-sulfur cluster biosynthetic enzyme